MKAIAPLACKTDKVDARVLAQLAARDLVPELWVPSLSDRELRERLRRREHLVHLRTSARNRMFGLLTQWGLRGSRATLRKPGALERLAQRDVPAVWIQSIRARLKSSTILTGRSQLAEGTRGCRRSARRHRAAPWQATGRKPHCRHKGA